MTRRDLGYVSAYTSTISYVSALPTVDFLLIGGGGAGGGCLGGGGGAGGYMCSVSGESSGGGGSAFSPFSFTPSTNYSVTIGAGGASALLVSNWSGNATKLGTALTAVGGGMGAGDNTNNVKHSVTSIVFRFF